MVSFLPALVAHLLNATVFVVDKGLLGQRHSVVGRPAWYAAYSGLVAAGAGLLLLYQFVPLTLPIAGWSLLAGGLWVVALWFFFRALQGGEPSRVVPIAGSAVPVFTWLIATVFLAEQLTGHELLGVGVLILGGLLLSVRWHAHQGLPPSVLAAALASGAAFAGHFAITKYVYDFSESFLALFAYIRLGVGVWAALLLLALWWQRRKPASRPPQRRAGLGTAGIVWVFVASKSIGMVALLLQNYAIAQGSVTVVNALQGTQYLFILLLALALSRWAPQFVREELHRVALLQKIGGIVAVTLGLVLVVVQ